MKIYTHQTKNDLTAWAPIRLEGPIRFGGPVSTFVPPENFSFWGPGCHQGEINTAKRLININQLRSTVSRAVGIMTKIGNFIPFQILKQIYFAFIHFYLTYGVIVWGATYPSYLTLQNLCKLEQLNYFLKHHGSDSATSVCINSLMFLVEIIYVKKLN